MKSFEQLKTTEMDVLLKQEAKLYSSAIDSLATERRYSLDKLTFKELDDWRNVELPTTLSKRFYETKETWLTKDELVKLMDWKLMRGKFRPTLPKLIKSNEEKLVIELTKEGFGIFLSSAMQTEVQDEYEATLKKSLNKLCQLKGVGPATSTLMMSLLNKVEGYIIPPFFSDESFYWFNPNYGKLKYTLKEYLTLYLKKSLSMRLDLKDLNKLERVTWAINKHLELNPEFQIEPFFLKNYDTYIQKIPLTSP